MSDDRFQQFARNGRWGTCSSCPRDTDGRVFPEFCAYTKRYDHHLPLLALVEAYERDRKPLPKRGRHG